MVLKIDDTVFGSRHAKKLNIGDLVSWTEWVWEQTEKVEPDGSEPPSSRQVKCFGVISELFVDDREIRKVAMAKVVPMNTKTEKRLHERNMLATSLKLVSRGGIISGKKNYGNISD